MAVLVSIDSEFTQKACLAPHIYRKYFWGGLSSWFADILQGHSMRHGTSEVIMAVESRLRH